MDGLFTMPLPDPAGTYCSSRCATHRLPGSGSRAKRLGTVTYPDWLWRTYRARDRRTPADGSCIRAPHRIAELHRRALLVRRILQRWVSISSLPVRMPYSRIVNGPSHHQARAPQAVRPRTDRDRAAASPLSADNLHARCERSGNSSWIGASLRKIKSQSGKRSEGSSANEHRSSTRVVSRNRWAWVARAVARGGQRGAGCASQFGASSPAPAPRPNPLPRNGSRACARRANHRGSSSRF